MLRKNLPSNFEFEKALIPLEKLLLRLTNLIDTGLVIF